MMLHPHPVLPVTGQPIASRQSLVRHEPLKPDRPAVLTPWCGVLHMSAGGSALSSIEHLRKVGLGYHYIIERDGVIYRCASTRDRMAHAGESAWPGSTGNSLNPHALGVCLANYNGWQGRHEPVTIEQYTSTVWLVALLSEQDKIPAHLWLGHLEVSPGRKTDPDVEVWSMEDFRSDLTRELFRRRRDGHTVRAR